MNIEVLRRVGRAISTETRINERAATTENIPGVEVIPAVTNEATAIVEQ
jgi:hypothetical protein